MYTITYNFIVDLLMILPQFLANILPANAMLSSSIGDRYQLAVAH